MSAEAAWWWFSYIFSLSFPRSKLYQQYAGMLCHSISNCRNAIYTMRNPIKSIHMIVSVTCEFNFEQQFTWMVNLSSIFTQSQEIRPIERIDTNVISTASLSMTIPTKFQSFKTHCLEIRSNAFLALSTKQKTLIKRSNYVYGRNYETIRFGWLDLAHNWLP